MRASTSAWLSGDSFGAFEGCCVGGGVMRDSVLRRLAGANEAAADAKAARRANSRREIAESFLLPIRECPLLGTRCTKSMSERSRMRLLNLHSSVNYHRNVVDGLKKRAGSFSRN